MERVGPDDGADSIVEVGLVLLDIDAAPDSGTERVLCRPGCLYGGYRGGDPLPVTASDEGRRSWNAAPAPATAMPAPISTLSPSIPVGKPTLVNRALAAMTVPKQVSSTPPQR